MTTAPTPCRCGTTRDDRGLCPHCDYPEPITGWVVYDGVRTPVRACPVGCVPCRTRDSQCEVCRTDCATPVAATYHQKQCRKAENYLRNNPR